MKKFSSLVLVIIALSTFVLLQNCDNKDKETAKERTLRILQSKNWTVSSVVVPANSATEDSDWVDFTVSFSATNMTASDHPIGAQAVWPSGTYEVNEDGNLITRGDGVVMTLNPISDSNFTAIFTIENKNLGDSRIASLDGEYRFSMK